MIFFFSIDIRLTIEGGTGEEEKKKTISNATMNKTITVGGQFGTSDFLCGCWDE